MFFAHFQSGPSFFFSLPRVSSARRLCEGSLGPSRGENPDERRPSSPAHLALCRLSCNQRQRRRRPLMCARRFLFPPSHRLLRLSLSLSVGLPERPLKRPRFPAAEDLKTPPQSPTWRPIRFNGVAHPCRIQPKKSTILNWLSCYLRSSVTSDRASVNSCDAPGRIGQSERAKRRDLTSYHAGIKFFFGGFSGLYNFF